VIERHDSVIVRTMVRLLLPWIQIFALYVVFHGHYSPGGGFQGGVMLAAGYILVGLALGRAEMDRCAPEPVVLLGAAGGALLFLLTGVAALVAGGALLDYGALPLPGLAGPKLRAFGVLLIEIGITAAVAGTLLVIFARLAKAGQEGDA
jgi:multicomponent Na+:H+ antiporter subunit B